MSFCWIFWIVAPLAPTPKSSRDMVASCSSRECSGGALSLPGRHLAPQVALHFLLDALRRQPAPEEVVELGQPHFSRHVIAADDARAGERRAGRIFAEIDAAFQALRSEERRVGKECRSR